MNGTAGLSGWRWLFIIEGIPSCLAAFLVLFFLPDYPERAKWLSEAEKDMAIHRLYYEGSKESHPTMNWAEAKETLMDWRLYAHYAIYFASGPAFASLSLFAPSITVGLGYFDLKAQLMTVPPWAIAYSKFNIFLRFEKLAKLTVHNSLPGFGGLVGGPLQRPRCSHSHSCSRGRHWLHYIGCASGRRL
jgi:hypothetical protein